METPNVRFSIAASVKAFLVTSCHIPSACHFALADVAARLNRMMGDSRDSSQDNRVMSQVGTASWWQI